MSPRKRNKENSGLPARWRYRNGSYCYMVPPGLEKHWNNKKEFRLGRSLSEAYKTWSERLPDSDMGVNRYADLCERYQREELPTKSRATQDQANIAIRRLIPVFGKMKPGDIEPQHAYRYFDLQRKRTTRASAKADIGVLRHTLTMAVQWGLIPVNPLLGQLRIEGNPKRERYIEDWEIHEMLALEPDKNNARGVVMLQLYIQLKLMTGLRRSDLLRLTLSNLKSGGLHVTPHKTEKTSRIRQIFEWTPELQNVIQDIKALPPRRIGNALLFVNRKGGSYINARGRADSFDSVWQRFVGRVLAETNITERFQEKDLRAKVGSDAATVEKAKDMLGHTNTATTEKSYRRKPVLITPKELPIKGGCK